MDIDEATDLGFCNNHNFLLLALLTERATRSDLGARVDAGVMSAKTAASLDPFIDPGAVDG